MDAQFEHLCRICAANTKCKSSSVVESIFIFKTLGLKDRIARHLFLNVAEDDPFPKVLCKSCYRQVEATASLSNIAKHTQRVFRDFLLSTVPRHTRDTTAAQLNVHPVSPTQSQDISDPHSSSNVKHNNISLGNDAFQPIMLTRPPETTITLTPHQKEDDVVISLAHKDIEVRQQQQQRQHSAQSTIANQYSSNQGSTKATNLLLSTRRNSVFGETRYSSTPMSIAQRSMQQQLPPSLAPLHPELALTRVSKHSPEKKNSPAGVINFIQTHGRITGNAPAITTSKGNKSYQEQNGSAIHIRQQAAAPPKSSSLPQTVNSTGVPNLPNVVIQQKRRNLKNALNNINAIRDGQVSLLKSSQPRQNVEDIDIRPLVTTTVVPHLSLYGVEPSVEEALPEHIIIAAPKKKKEEPPTLARPGLPKLNNITTAASKSMQTRKDGNQSTEVPVKTPPSMSSLTDAISLGNVIRDPDLLKLILKALKWPVTKGNCDEQMTRLKNSKFAVIMSDSNLLQDTDLTQLLGPYLGPMMGQKTSSANNITIPSPSASPSQDTADVQTIGDCTMPYKLPPETSVQLVPSSPTEQEPSQPPPISKRPQRKSRVREFVGDGPPNTPAQATTSNAALVANEFRNIFPQFGSNPADALNEALISLLRQQQESKNQRPARRSRSASTTSTSLNLEEIILIEPQPSLEASSATGAELTTFKLPPQKSAETSITRPIIKRRKVVMQTAQQSSAKATTIEKIPMSKIDNENITAESEPEHCKNTEGDKSNTSEPSKIEVSINKQNTVEAPTSTVPEVVTSNTQSNPNTPMEPKCGTVDETINTVKSVANKQSTSSVRKTDVKSALGQKLLEAIGLPQPGKDSPRDTLRSALKRSLKQAQEQQQQLKRVKQEEPVKQMADSTTKSSVGESSDDHKKAIAERELELLKRKAKNAEKNNLSIKDEKSERTDVSSSSSRNRRVRNKVKTDIHEEDSGIEEKKSERWDDDDDLPLRTDLEKSTDNMNRSSRTSKTMSKYYKSPGSDKKPHHAMGTRSTRQR